MLIEYALALGLTMIMSAVTVYFRDVEYILGILAMAWQFLTPVMYAVEQVPSKMRWLFSFNPMTYVITAYRDILYNGEIPKFETLFSSAATGIAVLLIGWILFDCLQKRFAEEL